MVDPYKKRNARIKTNSEIMVREHNERIKMKVKRERIGKKKYQTHF